MQLLDLSGIGFRTRMGNDFDNDFKRDILTSEISYMFFVFRYQRL
jgi:hypothetical protein